jgi:hypothetical protein
MKLDFNRLFAGKAKEATPLSSLATVSPAADTAVAPSLYAASTGEEYEEFLKLMQAGKRPYRKPGVSVKQEYEMWLAARSKQRAATVPENPQA